MLYEKAKIFFPEDFESSASFHAENRLLSKNPCGHGVDKLTHNDSVKVTQAKNRKRVLPLKKHMTREGLEPSACGLRVRCSTS